jgi:hypothetical protein
MQEPPSQLQGLLGKGFNRPSYLGNPSGSGTNPKDFITKVPRTSSGNDSIWVIEDRLIQPAYSLPIRKDYRMENCRNCVPTSGGKTWRTSQLYRTDTIDLLREIWQSLQKPWETQSNVDHYTLTVC